MRITTKILDINDKMQAHVNVKVETSGNDNLLRSELYLAIIKAMKDTDRDAFYEALSEFVTVEEYQDAMEYFDFDEDENE